MEFSSLVDRLTSAGESAWEIHHAAVAAQKAGRDVILLSVGDPDVTTDDVICQRAIDALQHGDTHYTEIPGRDELRLAIAKLYRERFATQTQAANVIIMAGAQNGLYSAAQCLLDASDEAIVFDPSYVTYEATIKASGAKVVSVATDEQNGFRLNPQALRAAISDKTKALFFANPNNPTGRVMDHEEMQALADIAIEFDLWVVCDEVYASLCFDKPHIHLASLPGMAERTVTLGSLSKSHAMTGWRAGWVVANAELISHIERLSLNMFYGLAGFVQSGMLAAIEHYTSVTTQMKAMYLRRRELVVSILAQCEKLSVVSPDAGMFILVDIRQLGMSTHDFTWQLFESTGVSVLDAGTFGATTEGFIRLSFTLSDEDLTKACERILHFVTHDIASLSAKDAAGISTPPQPAMPNAPQAHKKKKVIEVDRLHKSFGSHEVLKGVSLTAHEGEVISLIGGSGSGKSTLLRCINMLEVPDKGLVYIDGEGIDTATDNQGKPYVVDQRQLIDMRSRLGMVFQNFNLWPHRTIIENLIEAPIHVLGVPKAEAIDKAESLLKRVGLADKRNSYPSFLSGGQQQRVAIARALAVEPKAMLFDEPTSALDPELVGEVLKVIRSLAEEGRTMILVTHEMAFARDVSNKVAFLHQGVIEEYGTPQQVFNAPRSERCRQFINAHASR